MREVTGAVPKADAGRERDGRAPQLMGWGGVKWGEGTYTDEEAFVGRPST